MLLEGSLVNLGDMTVIRKPEDNLISAEAVETGVLKISIYKDEWEGEWLLFTKSPLKLIFQQHTLFTLCNGQR